MPERGLFVESEIVPEADLLALAAASATRPLFWWESPGAGRALLAVGSRIEIRASGPDRLTVASARIHEQLAGCGPDGIAVGGFAFADVDPPSAEWRELPSVRFFVPQWLWLREGGITRRLRFRTANEENPDELASGDLVAGPVPLGEVRLPELRQGVAAGERRRWRERVEAVRARIAAGELAKVVLSRSRRLRLDGPVAVASLLAALRARRSGCHHFWFAAGATDFLGSTPERLVRRCAAEVVSGALAGTAPRGDGPAADAALGESLLRCPKNRHEHDLVVRHVREALAPLVHELAVEDAPRLHRLPEGQHLFTPVRGSLLESRTVLELAARLHPTPAVCGVPTAAARRLLEAEEPDRGWYAGGIGWMNAVGDGEIAVALRSALVDGPTIVVRAGAGLVAASDPDAELAETEAKLAALFRGLAPQRSERAA